MTIREERPMTAELLVCWIDPDYDRANASDGLSRYGAYVRDYARLFDPWQDAADGVTIDPVEFAMAAFRVATGPIMSPGFVRWHPRVCAYGAERSERDGRLVVSVTLASPAPLRLPGWSWRGWERNFHDRFLEPEDRGPVALGRLELRWPLAVDQLHRPARTRFGGRPNLADATTAVAVVVGSVNHTAGPVLAALEAAW
jgi:hypothetical protein